MPASIDQLLARVRAATPADRIDYRDEIARRGPEAIAATLTWLDDPELWRFAIKVIGRAAELGLREEAIDALRVAGSDAPVAQRKAIDEELARIGAPGIVRAGAYGPIDDAAIRERLIYSAKRREVIHYADLAKATGREMKGRNWAVQIGRILGRISSEEASEGRPLLSVIVVSRDTMLPGGGFYNLGQEFHLVEPGEDEDAFVRRQTERVYNHWATRS